MNPRRKRNLNTTTGQRARGLRFRQASGYIETLLLQDRSSALRYITIDRWQSEEAYRALRAMYARRYDELDRERQKLTIREILLGEFGELR